MKRKQNQSKCDFFDELISTEDAESEKDLGDSVRERAQKHIRKCLNTGVRKKESRIHTSNVVKCICARSATLYLAKIYFRFI